VLGGGSFGPLPEPLDVVVSRLGDNDDPFLWHLPHQATLVPGIVAQQLKVHLTEELVVHDAVTEREPVTLQLPQLHLITDGGGDDWQAL